MPVSCRPLATMLLKLVVIVVVALGVTFVLTLLRVARAPGLLVGLGALAAVLLALLAVVLVVCESGDTEEGFEVQVE
ncbi:hypothetical protein [Pyrolobus fumarii]|nr:hypothetical protein [Pyrolobus fumarii]